MKTGAELKARREELKITQQYLADKVGLSRTQLSRMENGKIEVPIEIMPVLYDLLYTKQDVKSELTINDIQTGDELECIDAESFINDARLNYSAGLCLDHKIASKGFKVKKINDGFVILDHEGYLRISKEYLKYFRKKPKLQFSDLEVGDYVYVRDDLIDSEYYGNNTYDSRIGKGLLKITELNKFMYVNNCIYYVTPEMLDLSRSMKKEDYLKMNKEEIETFDDLIDVAFKAYKDGILNAMDVRDGKITFWHNDSCYGTFTDSIKEGIEIIKSLYAEEFNIESMADELKIISGAEITLSNGIKCEFFDDGERKLRFDNDFYPCNFLILKGATVKQQKEVK